jgi:glycosyltransferase involved in cell wall biosynthesis
VTRPVLFISWSVRHGRSRDLAAALGAEAIYIGVPRRRRRWQAPLRWAASSVATVLLLMRRRPRAVIVMAPPFALTALALAWGRIFRVPVAIDAHTKAVVTLATGRPRRGLQRLARFAAAIVVTNSQLAEVLAGTRCRVVIVHDPIDARGESIDDPAFNVVAPLSWEADEPFDYVVEAARRCPNIPFFATGRAPAAVAAAGLPDNLTLTGFLTAPDFDALIRRAGVVLALTTREATMQRAGYEAMALGVPVVASGTSVLREFFGDAALFADSASELAAAISATRAQRPALVAKIKQRRDEMEREFDLALAELKSALGLMR